MAERVSKCVPTAAWLSPPLENRGWQLPGKAVAPSENSLLCRHCANAALSAVDCAERCLVWKTPSARFARIRPAANAEEAEA